MFDWHNEESAAMLSRGYLLDGETVISATRRIAQSAAKYADDPSLEEEIFNAIGKGWIVPASPIWANMGTDRGLPISCVTGDTWINTRYGGGKQAKHISVGDEVLTHKGRYRPVTDVMITENRSNIYKLKVGTRMTPLYITENHLVLTNLGWVRVDELDENIHLIAINDKVEYVENDFTIEIKQRPIDTGSTKFQAKQITTELVFDEELAWAFGLWFAEGSLSTLKGNPNGLRITMGVHELEHAERWLEIMSRRFNVSGKISISENATRGKTAKWCNVNVHSVVLGEFFASFGKGCKNKLIPDWLMDSPKKLLFSFLDGLLLGDGHKTKDGGNRLTLANPKMILQVYQIALKLGLGVSLQMQEKAGKLATTKHVYTLLFRQYHRSSNRHTAHNAIRFNNGLAYAPIKELSLTNKAETVYDFTVEEDHSFSAAGVIVHNCFGSYIDDSIDGILSTLAEVGTMTKIGGGTSAYFGAIRPNGADIRMNGKSNGPVPFMQLFDTTMRVVSQGSTRRGSFAAYLPVEHPDILEFLKIKDIGFYIQDLSFGVTVTDDWMNDMIAGDPKKREIWAAVLHSRKEKGYPYILFTDTVNKMKPECYKDRTIYASNLCVAPEQLLLTSEGYLPIGTLEGKGVTVWNGSEWSKTTVIKTSDDAELLRVRFSDQTEINCTPWHKFYIMREYGGEPIEVRAHELQPGDKIQKHSSPLDITSDKELENAYSLGFYSGDGNEGYPFSFVYREKEAVIGRLFGSVTPEFDINGRKRWVHGSIEDKFFVPLGYSVKSKVDWLSGYFDADGCVIESDNCQNIQVTSVNLDFIKKVRLMLQEMGVQSSLGLRRDAGEYLLPLNDGSGENGLFDCKTVWLLNVNGTGVKRLLNIGLSTERLVLKREQNPNRDASRFVTVESVERTGRRDKTYCATEPIRHKLVFNGILTGNCSEIMLPSSKDESFVCCISAMNAEKYHEWKDAGAVGVAVRFLDAVMEEFIQKARGVNHMQRAVRFAENHRAIGLGLCGWHSLLQSKGYPFNSLPSFSLTHSLMGNIREQAEVASMRLKDQKGAPLGFPDLDRRNTTLMAIAPNTSSSSIMGQISAGIEPFESNYYVKDLAKGSFTRKNKHLEKILDERGLNTDETWRTIHKSGGSVLGIPEIKDVHQVFLTFGEINQFELLRQAGLRQQFIDQGQSLNIHVPPGTDLKTINKLHIAAWQAKVKALYYQRSRSVSQGFSLQDVCSMCAG